MRNVLKSLMALVIAIVLLMQLPCAAFAAESRNPLVEPYRIAAYRSVPDDIVNILLLGIDFGSTGYWGSGKKSAIESCHTDAVMVVAINRDKNKIDLVSLPRDTVTYVPGVKGVYKLNAAANCADTVLDGLQKTKSAAEWLLGNIEIDYYFAVDMNTMVALGDAIGGVDAELEMNYIGHSETRYTKGMQHLDGVGIMDYLRARTNATVNYNDIGRTNRQRQMMLAIFDKLRGDEDMIWNLLETASTNYDGFFTDITTAVLMELAMMMPAIVSVSAGEIGTHVFDGPYKTSNNGNIVHGGISIPIIQPLQYVSYKYQQWLDDGNGYSSVHYISVAQDMIAYINDIGVDKLSDKQAEAYEKFERMYETAVSAFELASDTMSEQDTSALYDTRVNLREAGDELNRLFGYAVDLPWAHSPEYWYNDPHINQYQFDWR